MPLHPRHIAPQIDALDTQSRSSIPPIPVIPSTHHSLDHIVRVRNAKPMHLAPRHASDSPTNHTKCTTFEYDYDCDLEPVPGPARIQPFALTKENIERLNSNNIYAMMSDSTSSKESDDDESLEEIGKQLREINIVNSSGDLSLWNCTVYKVILFCILCGICVCMSVYLSVLFCS
eukprot:740117_1